MELNSNLPRLVKCKGRSIVSALILLGGKASASELTRYMASSLNQPESFIGSDVKNVLKAAVMNGYLIRQGKNYLLSHSCRILQTDALERKRSFTSNGVKKEEQRNYQSTGFPTWWNKFWNRFVVNPSSIRRKEITSSPLSATATNYSNYQSTNSSELDKSKRKMDIDIMYSNPSDISQKFISPNAAPALQTDRSNEEMFFDSTYPERILSDEQNDSDSVCSYSNDKGLTSLNNVDESSETINMQSFNGRIIDKHNL